MHPDRPIPTIGCTYDPLAWYKFIPHEPLVQVTNSFPNWAAIQMQQIDTAAQQVHPHQRSKGFILHGIPLRYSREL